MVDEPVPFRVEPPGLIVMVQFPTEGNPPSRTLPVVMLHVGCVTRLIAGAEGTEVIVTEAVATVAPQPPDAAMVYDTVYVPAVLDEGVIAPVEEFIVSPEVEEYVPPDVPVLVTGWALVRLLQYGDPG